MNNKLLYPLLVLLFISLIASVEGDDHQLVGKWAADVRTKGGLGSLWTFTKDGIATLTFGSLVDFQYQVEGQTLKTLFRDKHSGEFKEVGSELYELTGDRLIINGADPKKRQEMERIGVPKKEAASIVGIWSFKHDSGVMATMEYTTTGLAQLSVPFNSEEGLFKLQTEELAVEFKGRAPIKRTIHLQGDHLTFLATGEHKEEKYTRVVP